MRITVTIDVEDLSDEVDEVDEPGGNRIKTIERIHDLMPIAVRQILSLRSGVGAGDQKRETGFCAGYVITVVEEEWDEDREREV